MTNEKLHALHKYLDKHLALGGCPKCDEPILVAWTYVKKDRSSFESHICMIEESEFFGKHTDHCLNCLQKFPPRLFPDLEQGVKEIQAYEQTKNN